MKTESEFDYVIIGAGPAGTQLGYSLEEANRNYIILEGGDKAGTFFEKFPRHRQLISINKAYTGYDDPEVNMRWDWNSLITETHESLFKEYTKEYFPGADHFVTYLNDFAERYALNIQYNTRVVQVSKDETFRIVDQDGNIYRAKRVIVATGAFKPYLPPIPGIDLAELYTEVSVDPQDFINQRVLILGKGNSGFETADNLVGTASVIHIASPHSLKLAWQTHFVGHLRAVNNNFLDTYQLKSQNAVIDANVDEIRRKDGKYVVSFSYAHANGEREDIVYDRIIVCTGFRFDDSIFDDSCRPELVINNRFPNQTSAWESTNIEDLYFAGALMQMRDYKKCTSAFIHGFRYNVLALSRILNEKYHGASWPQTTFSATVDDVTNTIIQRINKTSALWQVFGFLGDVLVIPTLDKPSDGQAHFYEEVPVDYLRDIELGQQDHYYILTLEYGPNHDAADPFNVTRVERHDADNAELSNFLHPVIRRYSGSELVAEHHIIEDLESEWVEAEHIEPLRAFFAAQLEDVVQAQELVYA